jgi:hypothetical protein
MSRSSASVSVMDFFGGIRTEISPRAIPKNRPLAFLAMGRATNHLVISRSLASLRDSFFQFERLFRELAGLVLISTELMHFP